MDHTELFDVSRTLELAKLAAADMDIPAPIRAELSDGVASMTRAVSMIETTIGDQMTAAQRSELSAFLAILRANYEQGIKSRTRQRFSDAGSKRAARKRAEMQASRGR